MMTFATYGGHGLSDRTEPTTECRLDGSHESDEEFSVRIIELAAEHGRHVEPIERLLIGMVRANIYLPEVDDAPMLLTEASELAVDWLNENTDGVWFIEESSLFEEGQG